MFKIISYSLLIIFLLLLFISIRWGIKQGKESKKNMVVENKDMNVVFRGCVKYLSGLPNIIDENSCQILISESLGLVIKLLDKRTNVFKETQIIKFKDIVDVDVISEEELRESVTLGRIALFGVFAMAFKKKEVVNNIYMNIKYIDELNKERNIIFTIYNNSNGKDDMLNISKKLREILINNKKKLG